MCSLCASLHCVQEHLSTLQEAAPRIPLKRYVRMYMYSEVGVYVFVWVWCTREGMLWWNVMQCMYVCMYVWNVIFSVYCWYVHAYTYMCCVLPSQYMSHYTVVVYAHYSVPSVIRLSAMLSVATTLHSVAGSAPHGLLDFPLHHLERLAVLWVGDWGGDAFVWGAWYPVNALWVGGLEHTGWLW